MAWGAGIELRQKNMIKFVACCVGFCRLIYISPHSCMNACMHACTFMMYVRMCVWMYVCVRAYARSTYIQEDVCIRALWMYAYVRCGCMYARAYVRARMDVCVRACEEYKEVDVMCACV